MTENNWRNVIWEQEAINLMSGFPLGLPLPIETLKIAVTAHLDPVMKPRAITETEDMARYSLQMNEHEIAEISFSRDAINKTRIDLVLHDPDRQGRITKFVADVIRRAFSDYERRQRPESEETQPAANGGVNITAGTVTINGNVVGRDMNTTIAEAKD